MPIVQCPECDKKLKLNNAVPGKKVRCPGCKSPFVPVPVKKTKAAPAKRRKSPPPEDDYVDDEYGDESYGDDDGYEEEPAPRKRRPAAGRGKGSKKKTRSKSKSETKSRTPLFIAIGVVALAAIIGGVAFMMSGGDDEETIASSNSDPATAVANGGEHENDSGVGADEHAQDGSQQSAVVAESNPDPPPAPTVTDTASGNSNTAQEPSVDDTMAMFSAVPGSSSGDSMGTASMSGGSAALSFDPSSLTLGTNGPFAYLPPNSEVLATVSVTELLDGPLGMLVQQTEIAEGISEAEEQLGIKLSDVESITLGIGEFIKAAAEDRPPRKDEISGAVRLKLKTSVELSQIESIIQGSKRQEAANFSYLRVPSPEEAVAVFIVDSNTLVVTAERMLPQMVASSGPAMDTGLLDGTSSIQVAFTARDPAVLQGILKKQQLPPTIPPPMQPIVQGMMNSMVGASLGLELSKDIGFTLVLETSDSQVAKQAVDTIGQMNELARQNVDLQVQQVAAVPMVGPMLGDIVRDMTNNQTVSLDGNRIRIATDSKQAGAKLAPMVAVGYSMFLQPQIVQARDAAKRMTEQNNLKMIGLAMHNFHDYWPTARFPNSTPRSEDGQPLLSWRVHLLPFLGQEELYEKFNVDEPWDSAHNIALLEEMPSVYRNDEKTEPGFTTYLAVTGPGTAFEDGAGRSMRDFTDGTSNTIMVVDVRASAAVEWTKPVDWDFNPDSPMQSLDRQDAGAKVLMVDGSVQYLRSPGQAASMMTVAAGD